MFIHFIVVLTVTLGSSICTCSSIVSHQSRADGETFTQNGLKHHLPTVTINSDYFTVQKVHPSFWKISDVVNQSESDNRNQEYEESPVINIQVTGTYPLYVFYELDMNEERSTSFSNSRDATDIFNKSTFIFRMRVSFLLEEYMESKNNSFEFRSIESPFFGVSISFFYNPSDDSLTFTSSPQISASATEYFEWRASGQNNICEGYVFIAQVVYSNSYVFQNYYGCTFLNGKKGKLNVLVSSGHNILSYRGKIFRTRKSCWSSCRNNSGCKLEELSTGQPEYQWSTQLAECNPQKGQDGENAKQQESFSSTPLILGLPHGESQLPKIYFNYADVEPGSMILMKSFIKYQELNKVITINCTFSEYYAAPYFKFALKYKNKSEDRDLKFFEDRTQYSKSMSFKMLLRSSLVERVYCFAPVLGSYDWINASQPIQILDVSKPTFMGDDKTAYIPVGASDKSFVVKVKFRVGAVASKDQSITCNVTGYPAPTITWTHNDTELQESYGEVQPYEFTWSQLILPLPTIDTPYEKTFVCKARNGQGVATATFHVIVADDDNRDYLESSSSIISIVTPLTLIGFCVLLAISLAILRRKLRKEKPSAPVCLTDQEVTEFMNGSSNQENTAAQPHCLNFQQSSSSVAVVASRPFDSKFVLPRSSITFDANDVLGSGHCGLVYKGWFCKNENSEQIQVAIKTMKQDGNGNAHESNSQFKALLSEVKINAYLDSHPNIVGFFGACTENIKNGEIFIAMEICRHGNLLGYLQNKWDLGQGLIQFRNAPQSFGSSNISSVEINSSIIELFNWSRDIANGMSFLRVNNIIHGDLAARNVLLTHDKVAKISDFGLSRQLLNDYSIYVKKSKVSLPWRWMALESLTASQFSAESDVWSFGVTMWEIFSLGVPPYYGLKYNAHFVHEISGGHRLPQPQLASDEIYELMGMCWVKDPLCRPLISSVVTQIQDMIANFQNGHKTTSESEVEVEYSHLLEV